MKTKRPTETYFYSPTWKGEKRNFNWSTGAMASSDGCVQINQGKDTVLLSPAQWKALVKWVKIAH